MVNKTKIFDITPPEKVKKVSLPEEPKEKLTFKERLVLSTKEPKKPPSFPKKGVILISGGLILIVILSLVFIKPKAEIEIWPIAEVLDFKTQVTVLIGLEDHDFSSNQISGEIIKIESAVTQEFAASGTVQKTEKAEGVIKVYNNYHLQQILVVNTRFWCFEGEELLEFKTKERVVIPSKSDLDVKVIASSPGEEYNIKPCTFSIPGLKGSSRYTAVYGESFSPMTGGAETEVRQVTQDDLDQAQEILTAKALEESKLSLRSSISLEEYIIIEEAATEELVEAASLTEKREEADKFIFEVKAEAKVPIFKKSILQEFVKVYIRSQIPEGKDLEDSSLSIKYVPALIILEDDEIVLDLEISAKIYSIIDEGTLKEIIRDKKSGRVKELLKNFPEINRAEVRFWPFWITKAPADIERIKINLNLD